MIALDHALIRALPRTHTPSDEHTNPTAATKKKKQTWPLNDVG